MMDDLVLLEQYAAGRSEQAFAAIVRRYAGFVYAAALRQARDPHLAEDVAQAVFVDLSRKAGSLDRRVALAGWLLTATRYAAANALRQRLRRQHHERKAATMRQELQPTSVDSSSDDPTQQLEAAIATLSQRNRDALMLRYFEGASMRSVAQRLGISEDAAKQRISRALEQVRAILNRQGLALPAVTLVQMLTACATQPAPAGLVESIVQAAATSSIPKGVALTMALSKTKAAAIAAATLLVIGGGTVVTWRALRPEAPHTVVLAPISNPTQWQAKFNAVYGLAPGQSAKFVPAPFIPERQSFWIATQAIAGNLHPDPLGDDISLTLQADGSSFEWRRMTFLHTFAQALQGAASIKPEDLDDSVPRSMAFFGDWVVRKGATTEQVVDGISQVLSAQLGRPVRLERRRAVRDTVVVSGTYHFVPLPGHSDDGVIDILAEPPPRPLPSTIQKATLGELLAVVGRQLRAPIVDQTGQSRLPITIKDRPEYGDPAQLARNIAAQTSLQFSRQPLPADLWFLVDSRSNITRARAGAQ